MGYIPNIELLPPLNSVDNSILNALAVIVVVPTAGSEIPEDLVPIMIPTRFSRGFPELL
jgi:hypothetical protein